MDSITVTLMLSLVWSAQLVACRPINSDKKLTISSSNGGAQRDLQQAAASLDDAPAGGVRKGYYLVVFQDDAEDLTVETQRLISHVRNARRGGAVTGDESVNTATADLLPFGVEGAIGGTKAAQQQATQAAALATAAEGDQPAPAEAAAPEAKATEIVSVASAAAPSVAHKGVMGLVVKMNEDAEEEVVLEQLRSAQNVKVVVQDLILKPQVTRLLPTQAPVCVEPQYLSWGLSATPAATFAWPGCKTTANKLVWIGQRCGASHSQIYYTAVYAVKKANPSIIAKKSDGTPCVLRRSETDARFNTIRFGSRCGAAPTSARALPTKVCSATSAPSDSGCIKVSATAAAAPITATATLQTAVTCGAVQSRAITYYGSACGPENKFVKWDKAVVGSCTFTPKDPKSDLTAVKFNADMFGDCGVPPANLASTLSTSLCAASVSDGQSPPPASPPANIPAAVLPRVPLARNENLPPNMLRIEAGSAAGGVVSLAGLPAQRQIKVAVLDSGIDGTHPDLNVVVASGVATADPAADLSATTEKDPVYDAYGHGTHVGGIIGAMNTGTGLVGVSPGVPLIAVKITNGKGIATLSSLVAGLNWILSPEGQAQNIGVINLSMGIKLEPFDKNVHDMICGVMDQVDASGIVIVGSAGNDGESMENFMPSGYCSSMVAVTALDAADEEDPRGGIGSPAGFSNWLPDDDRLAATRARLISAPGSFINSTLSYAKDPLGYRVLSGTSMASPHVAGVVANCIMSGLCTGTTGMQKFAVVQQAAAERLKLANMPVFGFPGDATSIQGGKYYGNLVYAGRF